MLQSWRGGLLPHHSSALSCTLRKLQLPWDKLLHGEGKAGSAQRRRVLKDPCPDGWLHICTPGSPRWRCLSQKSVLAHDQTSYEWKGRKKSREVEVLLRVKEVCAWAVRLQKGVEGISRRAELQRAIGVNVQARGCPMEWGGLIAVGSINRTSVEMMPPIFMLLLPAGPSGI